VLKEQIACNSFAYMSNLETLVIINSGDDGASNLIVLTLVNMHILNLIVMLFFFDAFYEL